MAKAQNDLKAKVLTVGGLIAIVGAGAAVIKATMWTSGEIDAKAKSAVRLHCDKDIDRAHPDIAKRYVPRYELQQRFHAQETQLSAIQATQKQILNRLPRRRRTRSRENGDP